MFRRIQPHVPGLIYIGLLMLVAIAAMNNQNNLLFWVFGVMMSGLVISAFISSLVIWSIRVRRIDPRHGAVGEPLIVRYALSNRSRLLSAFNIHIEERVAAVSGGGGGATWRRLMNPANAWIMHIGPRETVHGEAIFWPTHRGEAIFDRIRISTTFPFGIIRKSTTVTQPQHTLIYPMLYELRRGVLEAMSPAGLMGLKVTQHAGAGDDYYGMREFRSGDSLRHIAWKRTARLDQLITIERTTPSPAKLRVVLDLTTPTEKLHTEPAGYTEARELEERAISLAASIIHSADKSGYDVGLTILGTDLPPIALRRGQFHVRKIMAALAGVRLDVPRRQTRTQPIRDAERAGLVVVVPDRVQPLPGRQDAMYFSARQLESLTAGPIGWDPSRMAPTEPSHHRAHTEAAA